MRAVTIAADRHCAQTFDVSKLMTVFYIFAALLLLQSLISLRGGFGYYRYLTNYRRPNLSLQPPFVSIILPFRGQDARLAENLSALLKQDYPAYEILFVTDAESDSAASFVRQLQIENPRVITRQLIAGKAVAEGQKVHNLRYAVEHLSPQTEIIVFADSDAEPQRAWLAELVAAVMDETVGAASGYRWFLPPERANLATRLRAVWNASIASALSANVKSNFCWGGATAIRRSKFEEMKIAEHWRGTLSDDFALTGRVRTADLGIAFVPPCLTAARDSCSLKELLEFTTRQLKITRVYAPHLWRIVLISNWLFTLVFWGGWGLAAWRAWRGSNVMAAIILLSAIYLCGSLKALLRWLSVRNVMRERERFSLTDAVAHLTLWTLTAPLFAFNALAAAFSRRIVWRGIIYEMKSTRETSIISSTRSE